MRRDSMKSKKKTVIQHEKIDTLNSTEANTQSPSRVNSDRSLIKSTDNGPFESDNGLISLHDENNLTSSKRHFLTYET